MSDRAKIRARRVTGNDAQQQREVARAIKNAREMALLPYTNRVTTQRTSRDRGPGGPGRADGPPPRPQGPPPGRDGEGDLEELDTGFEGLVDDLGTDDGELADVPDTADES
jgi:small subunit ribosomal protein S18